MKEEPDQSFLVLRETPVLQGLTTELLARHDTLVFWAIVNNPEMNRMVVIKQPESFQQLLSSQEFAEVFSHLGLTPISKLQMNGIDIPRVYEMLWRICKKMVRPESQTCKVKQ